MFSFQSTGISHWSHSSHTIFVWTFLIAAYIQSWEMDLWKCKMSAGFIYYPGLSKINARTHTHRHTRGLCHLRMVESVMRLKLLVFEGNELFHCGNAVYMFFFLQHVDCEHNATDDCVWKKAGKSAQFVDGFVTEIGFLWFNAQYPKF